MASPDGASAPSAPSEAASARDHGAGVALVGGGPGAGCLAPDTSKRGPSGTCGPLHAPGALPEVSETPTASCSSASRSSRDKGERTALVISVVEGRSGNVARTSLSSWARQRVKSLHAAPTRRAMEGSLSGPSTMSAITRTISSLGGLRRTMAVTRPRRTGVAQPL